MSKELIERPEAPTGEFLSGRQMRQILRICGYKESEYARFMGRSASYVNRVLGYERKYLPLSEAGKLRMMVGKENYEESMRQIGGHAAQKSLTGKEMRGVLEICGKTLLSFAGYLRKSKSFVCESLGYSHRSIGLQYIDGLAWFVGKDNYVLAIEKYREQVRLRQAQREASGAGKAG